MALRVSAALAVILLSGCGGVDELQRCIDHSVEEGFERDRAEDACRAALNPE